MALVGASGGSRLTRILEAAGRPVSAASLAFFRIAFGLAMVINTFLYLPTLVHEYYVAPSFNFAYWPFTFLEPLPGIGMHLAYGAMAVTGLMIALGLFYRWAAAAFFLLTTYVFLLDSTYFQNHEYLISLLSFLLIFLPADRIWSLDARRRPRRQRPSVPAWTVWLLRFQIGVPYFFGGIAKLNPDWLAGEPLRSWLAERTHIELIGPLFAREPVVALMNYGALVFDLTVVWFLLHRRTRAAAFIVAVSFHLLNARMFGLFIFPWLMIAATTIFFEPDWPERAKARVEVFLRRLAARMRGAGGVPVPAGGAPPGGGGQQARTAGESGAGTRIGALLALALAAWMAVQVTLPLRHFAIAESPSWTEEAHRFAWHMRLRTKQGTVRFNLTTADGRTWTVSPRDYLEPKQSWRLAGYPERLVQFARHLSELHDGAEVRAVTSVSLNGRRPQPIVDPTVDLAAVPYPWWGHADWILPLTEPLRPD